MIKREKILIFLFVTFAFVCTRTTSQSVGESLMLPKNVNDAVLSLLSDHGYEPTMSGANDAKVYLDKLVDGLSSVWSPERLATLAQITNVTLQCRQQIDQFAQAASSNEEWTFRG